MAVRKMLMTSLSFTTSFRLTRTTKPTIVPLPFPSHSRKVHSEAQQDHSATPRGELVGWWSGVCAEGKVPYGEIIHISANEGRYLAKSYSPWQLATGKTGTPLFEIYVTSGLQGEYKEQAVCLKHKAACQDSLGSRKDTKIQLDTAMFLLTDPNSKNGAHQWAKTLMRLEASEGRLPDSDEFRNFTESDEFRNFWAKFGKIYEVERGEATEAAVHTLEEKTAYYSHFAVGDIVEKSTTPNKDVLRVPAVLERKGCASFSLTLEEDKDSHVSGGYNPEDYCTTDHGVFDLVDCMARGIHRENVGRTKLAKRKHKDNLVIRAKNQLPLLSHLTIFNRIDVSVSSDPLNGLYIGSNGYLATEVIKIRRLFGPWQEIGSTKDVSELEVCEYLEAVNLTGDSVIPAGQVAFRAKVGEEYKLSPITYLEEKSLATKEKEGLLDFSLTVEEDKDSHVSHSPEDYCTTDHGLFDLIDCMARGICREKDGRTKVAKPKQTNDNLVIRAKNLLPLLSRLTIFNRIDVSALSDPLNGFHIGSNGYLVTEVIKIRRLFGPWQEVGGTKDVSELEWCDYIEAVYLTGDSVVPAGQVAFRAKVGEKYKLSPGIFLEDNYGAVARYKGEGRLAGFQESKLVDVEILILGGEYRRDGYAIGVLYSAPEYYFFKLFKQVLRRSSQDSN